MTDDLMKSIVTTGNGGYEKLLYKDVPIPKINPDEVLIKVLAAGVNNTEINTRVGWYSSSVAESTDATANEKTAVQSTDGGWNKQTPFPFIQGTDCCGQVIRAGADVGPELLGKRVLVRPCIREQGFSVLDTLWSLISMARSRNM